MKNHEVVYLPSIETYKVKAITIVLTVVKGWTNMKETIESLDRTFT